MQLVVGLGNPGAKYARTRHNVGFRATEEVARLCGARIDQSRWDALFGTGRHHRESVMVLQPQAFMNLSGEAAAPAARFFKVATNHIVVIHDELDFEFGRMAIKVGGGDGGHNGLKSLRQHLGTGEFIRVRVGVGRPPAQWDPADWVLSNFTSEEEAKLEGKSGILSLAAQAALTALELGPQKAMNQFNIRP
jgi:PTH1 family peptidyl-tRNA hydrolase